MAGKKEKSKKGKGKKNKDNEAANDPTAGEIEGAEARPSQAELREDEASEPAEAPTLNLDPPLAKNTTDKQFIDECLQTHNILRAKHGVSPLVLNADLGKLAQEWAKELAKNEKMTRYVDSASGENFYWSPTKPTGNIAPDRWYTEISNYDFDNPVGQKKTAQFTQLVWKATEKVGIAMESGTNGYYVVVNYFPPGNIAQKFQDNVKKIEGEEKRSARKTSAGKQGK